MKIVPKIPNIISSAILVACLFVGIVRNGCATDFNADVIVTGKVEIVNGPLLIGTNAGPGDAAIFVTGGDVLWQANNTTLDVRFDYDANGGDGALIMDSDIYLWNGSGSEKLISKNSGLNIDGSLSGQWIKFFINVSAKPSNTPDVLIDTGGTTINYSFSGEGTNNVLQNQILLSNDSVLTRTLADGRYDLSFTKIVRIGGSDDLYSTLNDNIADSTWFQIAPGTYNLTNTFSVNNGNDYVRISGAGYELTSITNNRIKIDAYGSYFDNFHAIGDDWFTFGNDSWALETTMESVKVTGNGAFATDRSGAMQFNLIDCIISGTNPLNLSSDGGNFALLVNTDVNGVVYNGEYTDFQNSTSSGTHTNDVQAAMLTLDDTVLQANGDVPMGAYTNIVKQAP